MKSAFKNSAIGFNLGCRRCLRHLEMVVGLREEVKGEIVGVERVTQPTAILSARATEAQIHSYSVLIKGEDGKLYTASSEDRQWQVAKPGYCVEALLYVYPPWDLDRAGTYFNARLVELSECAGKPVSGQPMVPPAESSAQPAQTDQHQQGGQEIQGGGMVNPHYQQGPSQIPPSPPSGAPAHSNTHR